MAFSWIISYPPWMVKISLKYFGEKETETKKMFDV
jgi:hypothetical protein